MVIVLFYFYFTIYHNPVLDKGLINYYMDVYKIIFL